MDEEAKINVDSNPENHDPQTGGVDGSNKQRVQDLYSWKSLNRPSWQYSREVFKTLAAVAFLLSIISALIQEWFAILVIWAAYFLFYALSRVPPVEVEHKITTEGIVSINKSYLWNEFGPFWFSQKGEEMLLHLAHNNIFGQLVLLIQSADKEKIRDILADYLPFIEVPGKSTTEKLTDWFSRKFPIEQMGAKNFKAEPTSSTQTGPTS